MEVWFKTPYSLCDFKESVQNITTALKNYFPNFRWVCLSSEWEVPACLFPIYPSGGLNQIKLNSNIHYTWSGADLSSNGCVNREQKILKALL